MQWTCGSLPATVLLFFAESIRLPMEQIIASKEVQVERKNFTIEFRQNERGQFLRITEESHGRRNTVMIPSPGLKDFTTAIAEVLGTAAKAATPV
jgi:hypothetical protein